MWLLPSIWKVSSFGPLHVPATDLTRIPRLLQLENSRMGWNPPFFPLLFAQALQPLSVPECAAGIGFE